ncbi:MAG TPA: efflux RND transporter periplasmic adaptor subunit [Anaerolineales bacterium]|nr:efflux RND transporter periplasmic adaptor subunit [Anaerolineales bacterium]
MKSLLLSLRARLGWLIVVTLILLAAGGYAFYQRDQAERARQAALASLRTEVIARGDLVSLVSATGSLLPEQQSSPSFLVPGVVEEVLVASGETVRAGQALARLDDADLQLAVRQAEDALAIARLNRQKLLAGPAEGDLAAAEANVKSANAAVNDLLKGVGEEQVSIARIKYDNVRQDYQQATDRYHSAVEFAKEYPRFAPSQATLDSLKAAMENAFYAAEIARLQWEQAKRGADQGSLSVGYARVAQSRAALAQLQAPPAELQIRQADLAVEQAQSALDQAKLRAAHAQLVAPFDGVVAAIHVKAGERVGSAVPAFMLVDLSHFHLDVSVDEVDVAKLTVGQAAGITLDALPGVGVAGRVERLAPAAAIVGGVVNYTVRIRFDATTAPLRSGMSATAQITVAEAEEALLVPNWAIRRDRRTGQAYTSLKDGDELKEVPIVTGLRGETHTEVKDGVSEGEVAAVSTAREGLNFFGGQ